MHLIHRLAEEEKEKKPYPKGKAPQSIQDFCTTTILVSITIKYVI